jgi:hypothetical protein
MTDKEGQQMNEQCAGCPWLDGPKKQCRRTPPRFCSMDDSANAKPKAENKPAADQQDEASAKIQRAA